VVTLWKKDDTGRRAFEIRAYGPRDSHPIAAATVHITLTGDIMDCIRDSEADWRKGKGPRLECRVRIEERPEVSEGPVRPSPRTDP
jgi:hypothetical protein